MGCTRSQFVTQLQIWVGLKESNGSHKKIIDIYNTIDPLPVGYKLKYTDAWCAGTVSAAAQVCNATDIIPTECSCPRMVEKAKKMGCWVEADNYTPQPGDIVMYDWDDSGKGDNTGRPDHVGGVEKIAGNAITVIEGNYSNAVKRRMMEVDGKYIRGYIVPKFLPDDSESKQTQKELIQIHVELLKMGCKGDSVKALQILLIGNGFDCGGSGADGVFGKDTLKALKKFQGENDLDADGICGHDTWSVILGVK